MSSGAEAGFFFFFLPILKLEMEAFFTAAARVKTVFRKQRGNPLSLNQLDAKEGEGKK